MGGSCPFSGKNAVDHESIIKSPSSTEKNSSVKIEPKNTHEFKDFEEWGK